MSKVLWSAYFRAPACFVVFALGYFGSLYLPILSDWSNAHLVRNVLSEVSNGNFGQIVKDERFAYALACMIVSTAVGLAFVVLIMDVAYVRLSLWMAARPFSELESKNAFKEKYGVVVDSVSSNPLIGTAWEDYARSFVNDQKKPTEPILAFLRPKAVFTPSIARERFFGLKLLPTIPGYFIGIGLLLTFIGLVIALSQAAGTAGANISQVQKGLHNLLHAATFKFSTSIAGLFSSIALSIIFRIYQINIEQGFDNFCRKLDLKILYLPPQYVSFVSFRTGQEQLQQLKEINDVQFFQKIGQAVGPTLKDAVHSAIEPLTAKLDHTVDKIDQANRVGIEGMVDRFTENMQGSAGQELRELANVLGELKQSLQSTHANISGSGEDFGRRMTELAEKFGNLIAESGAQFAAARAEVANDMAETGRKAADAVQESIREVLSQVGTQMASFSAAMDGFQQNLGRESEMAAGKAREAAEAATAAASKAAVETADQIRTSLADVVSSIRVDVEKMSSAIRLSEAALAGQAKAIQQATTGSNAAANAFEQVASKVTSASAPLLQASERIARAAETMSRSMDSSVKSLADSQVAARELAERISAQRQEIENAWQNYQRRFGDVDEALSKAVQSLAEHTSEQQKNIAEFVRQIDDGCAKAITSLQGIANSLAQNTEDLGETFDDFLARIREPSAVN